MNLSDKKKHYKAEIEKIASSVYNGEQKQLACYILDNANAGNIDSIYTFITQRVKLGFTFDAAPEVNHNCISLVRHNPKLTFGNIGGEHKLIIGENYDALKNLLVTYTKDGKGLIDVIYIDPPYNTEAAKGEGNNQKDDVKAKKFIYRDKFTRNGWLNMMRERLAMARKLLSDTGVIFVSIDDTEQAYLKVLMDEIFGEDNFVACCPRKTGAGNAAARADYELRKPYDFIIIHCKNKQKTKFKKKEIGVKEYKYNDEFGKYLLAPFQATGSDATRQNRPNLYYPIYVDDSGNMSLEPQKVNTKTILPKQIKGEDGRWMWQKEKFIKDKQKLYFDGEKILRKVYFNEEDDQTIYQVEQAYFDDSKYRNAVGTKELQEIIQNNKFNNPKPVDLIKHILKISSGNNAIILDFFAGSGTTGQAVMELNAEDGGNRKCILVTNNENNIATDITYERLYRLVNGKGTKGEKFPWTYKPEQPYLTNNRWEVFELEQAELKIDDFDKAKELLAIAEKEFKLLNPNYDMKGLDIYNQLASLNPYKATDTDKKNDKCN